MAEKCLLLLFPRMVGCWLLGVVTRRFGCGIQSPGKSARCCEDILVLSGHWPLWRAIVNSWPRAVRMAPCASGMWLRVERARRSAAALGPSAGWLLLQMDRALRVWAMMGACGCGTGKLGKRLELPRAAGVCSSLLLSPPMVQPWPRVATIRWPTYGTWLPWADAVS